MIVILIGEGEAVHLAPGHSSLLSFLTVRTVEFTIEEPSSTGMCS